jgi:FkbM family methyltransferase
MNIVSITMPVFIDYVKKYIPCPDVLMDLGCMDAKDALYFKECFPNAKVYAIEGLKDNYEKIKYLQDVIPIHAVVCNKDGNSIFHQKNINGIHGIYDRGEIYGITKHVVECCKFKTLIDILKETCIDVLKIDVEGATYDVLLSMEEFIHSIGIMHIETETCELFAGQVTENFVFDYLVSNDFIMLNRKCCKINHEAYQCDSVWLNRRLYDDRLVSK